MENSYITLQSILMKNYYKGFSKYTKGKTLEKKVAWVTAFTPVEILEALDILYYYPESYAAVIAASGKEQKFLEKSSANDLVLDCCAYSCCIEGCLEYGEGPRGIPPKPDVLIATNNQCNTLPNWWNILAERYQVPLIVLDYPGEVTERDIAFRYVTQQHEELIQKMEELSGNQLDRNVLETLIQNSKKSVNEWNKIVGYFSQKDIKATILFDGISFLITSRCKAETAELYKLMADELAAMPERTQANIPVFWLGYPLWYHMDRYLSEILEGFEIVGANYITWWNLEYEGNSIMEQLFEAYNYTFLNLSQASRTKRLQENIESSGATCTVTLKNKSCKCDFVSSKDIGLPQCELEIDMIDRTFLDVDKAHSKMELLKEVLCIE